jgi:ABC-2 type transport system permease protein
MSGKFAAIYRKELKIFFSQPIAYALITVFVAISGYFFALIANNYSNVSMRSLNQYQRSMVDLSILEGIFRPYFYNMSFVLLLVMPLITMRVFAEEKREGTSELLFTYPVTDLVIVTGKCLAAFTVFAVMIAGSMSSFVVLRFASAFEVLPVLSGYLGLLLLGGSFIMLGIFVSTLTESQVVAAVISFALLMFIWIIDWLSGIVGPAAGKILSNLSVIRHFDNFSKGVLDTSDLVYYVCFIFLFFFLTLRVLESKQWRS